jgi:hypothetical protein
MFGVDEFADTLILESGEMESISLTKTSKDNNIIHKVENGKFSFCVYESSKIKNPLEDWKKYSICLEGYLDTTKISSDTERVIIDGHSEYDAIIGYTYTTNADKKIHFDEIEDFNSVGIDQYVCLYFGYNDKWIELDFDELCSEIQVRELNISTEEELVKFIKEFLNKQTNNIKETIIMRNTYVFEDKDVCLETKYSPSKDKLINDFTKKWPKYKDQIKIDGDELIFIISNDTEISEHNKMVDFLESNVGNGRAFNGCGLELDIDFYKDLYDLFSDDEGKVMFNSGFYECNMTTVGKFDSGHYFELKSDGLHWRWDDDYEEFEDDYEEEEE